MQYGGYSPDEKYMLDLIINSIDFLEKAQTGYDLQDIDGIMQLKKYKNSDRFSDFGLRAIAFRVLWVLRAIAIIIMKVDKL